MKKAYVAPTLDVEFYELNSAIAAGCYTVVELGPGDTTHDSCWGDVWGDSEVSVAAANVSFYEGTCSCYYSSGGEGYYTS